MCLRWQNARARSCCRRSTLVVAIRARERAAVDALRPRARALGAAALVGALPQMAAWKALYGEWVLPLPAARRGLPPPRPSVRAARRCSRRATASSPGLPCSGRATSGFAGRSCATRPRSAWPLLLPAPGHDLREHVLGRLVGGRVVLEPPLRQPARPSWPAASRPPSNGWRRLLARRPQVAVGAAARAGGRAWNARADRAGARAGASLAERHRRLPAAGGERRPRGGRRRGQPAHLARELALRLAARPAGPDSTISLVGRYLFYRQNNLRRPHRPRRGGRRGAARRRLGRERGTSDGARVPRRCGPARVLAPLDVPEDLGAARCRARGRRPRRGRVARERPRGRRLSPPAPSWGDHRLAVAAASGGAS